MSATFIGNFKSFVRISDFTAESTMMYPPIKGFEDQPLVSLEQAVEPLVSYVPDIHQMLWTVMQNCREPVDDLSPNESASIMLYSMEWTPQEKSLYYILNTTLRSQNRRELLPWFSYLRLLITALAKLPSLPSQTIYRAIKMDMSANFPKGKTFVWWAFSSCTSSIEVLEKFTGYTGARTIFNIESDTAKDISQHSLYKTENEILLYPARQFQVISSFNSGQQLHIVQLREIQPPFPLLYIPDISSKILDRTISVSQKSNNTPKNIYQNQELQCLIDSRQQQVGLNLNNKKLNDEDTKIIVAEAIVRKQCKKLWLNQNKITATGACTISKALSGNCSLEELYLSSNAICDIGVYFLTESLSRKNGALKWLFLSSTGITDAGVAHLSKMLKTNITLAHLALSDNEISDKGVQSLVSILTDQNNTLQGLYLDGNKQITDLSVDPLLQMLQHNCSLKIFRLSDCKLSNNGKEKLRQVKKLSEAFSLVV